MFSLFYYSCILTLLVSQVQYFICCGDTNFMKDEEEGDLKESRMVDAWKELKQKTHEQVSYCDCYQRCLDERKNSILALRSILWTILCVLENIKKEMIIRKKESGWIGRKFVRSFLISSHTRTKLTDCRIYYSSDSLECLSIELLGTKPYYEEEWISDHYGLFATFKMIDLSDEADL